MTATLEATATTNPVVTRLQAPVLAATRVVVSFLFVLHGFVGLFGAFGGTDGMGGTVPFLSWPGWWGSVIHLVAGAFVEPAQRLQIPAVAVAKAALRRVRWHREQTVLHASSVRAPWTWPKPGA